ncbi:MAG: FKBP-type peptidyl-prolyl cis-trans isomerase [Bacteroidales bacterium]|jgi:FKBP-type peptidyl-prolyl cis-trans isomerase|nr:FKBP-type peptidyl-prolyl cis-trans isomerase [Bacteroidales bacterium]
MNKIKLIILFILLFSVFVLSCKHSGSKKSNISDNIQPDTVSVADINSFSYTVDSVSDEVAVLVIRPDGESEYIIDKPGNIFQKTKSGLEYKYITTGKNRKFPKISDVIHVTMTYRTQNDSMLFDSREIDKDFKMRLMPPSHEGGTIEEAFSMLREGDSAIFKIDAANFLIFTQGKTYLPAYVKKGDKFIFNIKMNKIVENSEFIKQNSEIFTYYIEQEKSLIERLVLEINYPRSIQKSGLNIISVSKGDGRKVKDGDLVTVDYTASFIDGSVFDSTIERNSPFRFVVGKNEVIEGLEEGVKTMNIGDHSIFIIPFRLAYGETRHGIIPPFSTLIFEVKLIDAG